MLRSVLGPVLPFRVRVHVRVRVRVPKQCFGISYSMPALFNYSMPHRIVNTEALLRYGPKHGLCFGPCFGTKAVLRSVLGSVLPFRVRVHVRVRVRVPKQCFSISYSIPALFSYSMPAV